MEEEEYRKKVEERRLERKQELELARKDARWETENETRIREARPKEKEAKLRAEEEARLKFEVETSLKRLRRKPDSRLRRKPDSRLRRKPKQWRKVGRWKKKEE
ncbi:hypothetical protein TNIN_298271 [Trichonephila inaurata madagascariensis]|uniref:Uncharacterized protein n=1 Tax=Trichonephila inaurata madagascariensis TaxID=2747483 RepID=A0A8X6YDP3_9ARAC|nr:hypothetical protein TNIN_298271 [Trichonephila inaurata madagascariensis]